jgi:hypothetical protein
MQQRIAAALADPELSDSSDDDAVGSSGASDGGRGGRGGGSSRRGIRQFIDGEAMASNDDSGESGTDQAEPEYASGECVLARRNDDGEFEPATVTDMSFSTDLNVDSYLYSISFNADSMELEDVEPADIRKAPSTRANKIKRRS